MAPTPVLEFDEVFVARKPCRMSLSLSSKEFETRRRLQSRLPPGQHPGANWRSSWVTRALLIEPERQIEP